MLLQTRRMRAGDAAEEAQTQAQVAGGGSARPKKRQDTRLAVSHEEAMAIQVRRVPNLASLVSKLGKLLTVTPWTREVLWLTASNRRAASD